MKWNELKAEKTVKKIQMIRDSKREREREHNRESNNDLINSIPFNNILSGHMATSGIACRLAGRQAAIASKEREREREKNDATEWNGAH